VRILIALFLLLPVLAVAASPVSLVEVPLDNPGDEAAFRSIYGELDVLHVKPGSHARLAARPRDLALLRDAGLTVNVLTEDMEAAFSYMDKGPGYGIYHTWSENIAFVDSLRLLYPEVISAKWSIGQSLEGRDIWAFRVSDNPDVDESEPEILIDGAHHAREVMAAEFPIMFAEYLAQNYGTDPEITWLLDNRELYIVPVVNPDGFVYNETIEPDGGGMWRKNRRDNGDGTMGVDLNRNYTYQWGYDDSGSSPTTSSETYRGTSAGSEPETQVMMAFINSREFRTQDSVHTYSNLTLYPWGYDAISSPDEPAFETLAAEMTRLNGYTPEPGYGLYPVNGSTFDWSYGATGEHDKIFCFTNEIGGSSDGFWPAESRRGELFEENIWPHIVLMRAAGVFITVHTPVTAPEPAKAIDPGQSGLLTFTVQNQSVVETSAPLTVTVSTDDPWLQLGAAQRTIGSLAPLSEDDLTGDPIPFTVDAACPDGHLATVTVTVPVTGGDLEFPLSILVGSEASLVFDDMESGPGLWQLDFPWGLTSTIAHSGTFSLTDSPNANYADYQSLATTLVGTYQATGIRFWHRHAIEQDYDYGRVQVSADGGAWTTVASFTGSQDTWTEELVTLENYAGPELGIRFIMETDQSVVEDGWYLDDITIYGLTNDNQAPPVPTPDPLSGSAPTYELTVTSGPDPEGSPVVCGFKIYGDALLTQLVAESIDIATTTGGQATWIPPSLPDGDYWWRAWSGDGSVRSDLCAAQPFTVNDISAAGQIGLTGPTLDVLGTSDGRVRLQVGLNAGADVEVNIYDLRGARVKQLHSGFMDGSRLLVWDGRDQSGRGVASGVYLVQARIGSRTLTGRVVLVR